MWGVRCVKMRKVTMGQLAQGLFVSVLLCLLIRALFELTALKHTWLDQPQLPTESRETHHSDPNQSQETHHSDPTLMIDDSAARALRSRARLLCWVPSTPKQLQVKVKAVNSTWLQRCDGHLFFIEGLSEQPRDVVSLAVPPGYYNLTTKVVTALQYLYRYHLQDYDWFVKADDDAYVVVENLRYLLAQYDPKNTVYLGHLYKRFQSQGYMSGGASYVLSREALRKVVEKGYKKNKCTTKGRYEDVEVAKCLHSVGVASHNSRDRFGRDTFHPLNPKIHIVGPIPGTQLIQDYFTMVSGKECCSQLTISFHKVDPNLMEIFDHLLYRTSVYGRLPDMAALQGLVKPGTVPPLKE